MPCVVAVLKAGLADHARVIAHLACAAPAAQVRAAGGISAGTREGPWKATHFQITSPGVNTVVQTRCGAEAASVCSTLDASAPTPGSTWESSSRSSTACISVRRPCSMPTMGCSISSTCAVRSESDISPAGVLMASRVTAQWQEAGRSASAKMLCALQVEN